MTSALNGSNYDWIQYGDTHFEYRLQYITKPTSDYTIKIHVHPDGLVTVEAPAEASQAEIKQAVRKRARWVINHLETINKQREHALARQYISGETIFYLGRRYMLKIHDQQCNNAVKLIRGELCIFGQELTADTIKLLINQWYRQRASIIFARRLKHLVANLHWLSNTPEWKLLNMKQQWGSCSPSGMLSLNPHLVKAPMQCVDYVLLHELCHLKEHNHSKHFYELLEAHMPYWRSIKARLDNMAELLLVDY